MSENTLKLPSKYKRPSFEKFKATPGYQDYDQAGYVSFFEKYEIELAEAYASGEVTEENYQSEDDEMVDADHDGLPDILHVRSQVRAPGNRTLRARQPTRHRFKQYLFGNPSLRLVRKRATRVRADDVRSNLDELIAKEAAGILSVHAPNGQRVDLQALKAGRVSLAPAAPPAPLPNPPLDSAARDIPAGENMPQHLHGTFAGDPIAQQVAKDLAQQKADEAEKKEPTSDGKDPLDPVDPAASTQPSTELQQPVTGVDGEPAPVQDQLPKNSEASVEAPPAEQTEPQAAPADPLASTEPVVAEEQDKSSLETTEEAAPPAEEEASSKDETKPAGKSSKKGSRR